MVIPNSPKLRNIESVTSNPFSHPLSQSLNGLTALTHVDQSVHAAVCFQYTPHVLSPCIGITQNAIFVLQNSPFLPFRCTVHCDNTDQVNKTKSRHFSTPETSG